MTGRELRNQRREAERKARKLEYQNLRGAGSLAGSLAGEPVVQPAPFTGPTGPRTTQGKVISSGNSLKHGLASGRIIVPGEDPAEFEALLQSLLAEHAPATETETLLVRQMAQSWWLTQRAIRIQNQAFTETLVDTHKLALFLRYQTTHERAFYRALNSLLKLQKERRKSAPEFVSQKAGATPEFVSQNQGWSGLSGCHDGFPAGIPASESA